MRYAQLRNQRGFTLVEMLVAISIFLLILVGVFQIFDPVNPMTVSTPSLAAARAVTCIASAARRRTPSGSPPTFTTALISPDGKRTTDAVPTFSLET